VKKKPKTASSLIQSSVIKGIDNRLRFYTSLILKSSGQRPWDIDRGRLSNSMRIIMTGNENPESPQKTQRQFSIVDVDTELLLPIGSQPGYWVDQDGNVYSQLRSHGTGRLTRLDPVPSQDGYVRIHTAYGWRYHHRLVAEAFQGPIPEGFEVDHLDNVRSNNCPENLEIVPLFENRRRRDERARRRRIIPRRTRRKSGGK
jgi:hypothetical protein